MAIAAVGTVILVLAQDQPAWLGGHVGPGLMAQLLGVGVTGLGGAWALIRGLSGPPDQTRASMAGCSAGSPSAGLRFSGPALLGAVLVFALTLPVAGLVVSAGLSAAMAAWGAGERKVPALAATVLGLMALVAVIGGILLPPTAPLWPTL
ncbi:hypothetical protein RNZ50_07800 [Paracoccaceae bacterium Fryx2]|nr:hypothetical protein [Paracoccaceae bacterium Fryx2]